jgi:hypothetical protein
MDKSSKLWPKFEEWINVQKKWNGKIADEQIKLLWECFLRGALAQKQRQG